MSTESSTPLLPKNFLRAGLLLLLRESPAHGYELLERLRTFGYGGLDPGGLYRSLRGLEDDGFVRSAWETSDSGPDRRIYELTGTGTEQLDAQARALVATTGILASFLERYKASVALPRGAADREAPPAAASTRARVAKEGATRRYAGASPRHRTGRGDSNAIGGPQGE